MAPQARACKQSMPVKGTAPDMLSRVQGFGTSSRSAASSEHLSQAELAKGLHCVLPQRRRSGHSDAQRAARWQFRPLYASPPHLLRVHVTGWNFTSLSNLSFNIVLRAQPLHRLRMYGERHQPLITSTASVIRVRQWGDPPRGLDQRVTGRSPAWRSPSLMPPHRTGKMHRRQCLHDITSGLGLLHSLDHLPHISGQLRACGQTTFCFRCIAA